MRLFARTDVTVAIVAALFAAQAFIRFGAHLDGDIAWYLYAAGRLLDGARYYHEVTEISSPLGLWLAVPVVALADLLGVGVVACFKAVLFVLSAVVLLITARLLSYSPDVSREARHCLSIAAAALLLFLPGVDFGQREHATCILLTPWVLLAWLRLEGHRVPLALAALIGLLAGLGFWLKPHFMLVFVGVVIVVMGARRDLRGVLRIENLMVVLVGGLYLAAMKHYFARELVDISTLGTYAYIPFFGAPFDTVARLLVFPVALFVVAAIAGKAADNDPLPLLRAALLATGATFILVSVVQTGEPYQGLPALYFLGLAAFASFLPLIEGRRIVWIDRLGAALAGVALVALLAVSLISQRVAYTGQIFEETIAREAPDARSLFIASNSVDDGFPLVVEKDLVWASRFPRQWMNRFVTWRMGIEGGLDDYLVVYASRAAVDDLIAVQPEIVFVEQSSDEDNEPFDYIGFFNRDARFRDFWEGYEPRDAAGRFAVFVSKQNSANAP